MRKTQLNLNRMRKYQMLVNRKQEEGEEGVQLFYTQEGRIGCQDIADMEENLDSMRAKLNSEMSQRWRSWVDNSWGHKKNDIYKWIR
eukprot:6633713-Heterocapsa_arctica.AAC.1